MISFGFDLGFRFNLVRGLILVYLEFIEIYLGLFRLEDRCGFNLVRFGLSLIKFGFSGARSPVDLTFVFLFQEVRDLERSWID